MLSAGLSVARSPMIPCSFTIPVSDICISRDQYQYTDHSLFPGHGGQTEDRDGDEDDGSDEVIYPVDFEQAGHIVDDEIHFRVVKPLQQGVRLTAIFDSCHSATVMDLPYVYSTKGVLKEPNLAKEAGQGLLGAISSYASGNMAGVASSIMGFAKQAFNGDEAYKKTVATRTSSADVIMWSGSKDDQTSYVLFSNPIPVLLRYSDANTSPQCRRHNWNPGHRCHVVGFHFGPEEEPQTELRRAAQQYSRGSRDQIYSKAAAVLQSPSRYALDSRLKVTAVL